PQVAEAMALGARRALGADWALSTTGVAGPGGGTVDKPVGLVYIACAGPAGEAEVQELRLGGTRERIRERSTALALQLLRRSLGGTAARLLGAEEGTSGRS
ncbi:MAG: nicotinamide-nucleotide amidohydrolase family protein, partial [Miltoncostaeaceae bacterium]